MKRSSIKYQTARRTTYQEYLDEQFIQQILLKKGKERTTKDLLLISNFLEKTELIKKFQKEKIEEKAIRKMTLLCSSILEYQFVRKGELVFRQGDPSDKLYLILKGRVKISRLREIPTQHKMNGEEYFKYLIILKEKKEEENMKMTIRANFNQFPVDIKDSEYFSEILFKLKLRRTASKNSLTEIIGVLQEFNKNPKDFNIDLSEIEKTPEKEQEINFSSIRKKTFKGKSVYKIHKYLFIENKHDIKSLILYKNEHFTELIDGNYFGDMHIEGNPVRCILKVTKEILALKRVMTVI